MAERLPPEQLHTRCNPADFAFVTTAELPQEELAIGQERALEALQLGLAIDRPGFNLFALGSAGTGKTSVVRQVIEQAAAGRPAPDDWCYVHHFQQPAQPKALRLPAGMGRQLANDIDQLLEALGNDLPAAFEREDYRVRADAIEAAAKTREASAIHDLRRAARTQHIALIETSTGFAFVPIDDSGAALSPEAFQQLSPERQQALEAAIADFHQQLQQRLRQFPVWRSESRLELKALRQETAAMTIQHLIDPITARYESTVDAARHLETLRQALIEHAGEFLKGAEAQSVRAEEGPRMASHWQRYRIHLLVDNSHQQGAPCVFEDFPHHANLVGRIEHQAHMGTLLTDFTLIRSGALHRANGGYLVMDALQLLRQPLAWEALKRTLKAGKIVIEPLERTLGLISTTSLEPEPIPLKLKVILTGERLLYYLLDMHDPEFRALFKIAADFEDTLDRTPDNSQRFARWVGSLARRDGLRPLTREAVMRVIEHSARAVDDAEKLGTHLGDLTDLLQEADHAAQQQNRTAIEEHDIRQALEARIRRASRLRDQLEEQIQRGALLIDTVGCVIGQINALALVSLGDFRFGHPVRITATTRLGAGKIIDIERETELGGPLHSKGVFILSAFLAAHYARVAPLSLSASLVFEQSYGDVEGDSASLAELCALISSLSDLPIEQGLAVTGSVNQRGLVQAIGGVNEKIEGFFDTCRQRGLTGRQGVIIPQSNRAHLMLREDLVEAVAGGHFHVYAVSTVNEAFSLLMNTAAGERSDAEGFPPGSINSRVELTLQRWALQASKFGVATDNAG